MAEQESSDKIPSKPNITPPDKTPTKHEHMDEILDEALDETFPASDPIELSPCDNGK